jgi:hypothetical protein
MTTPRGLRKQKKYNDSSSNSEGNEGQNLTKQKKYDESNSDSDNNKVFRTNTRNRQTPSWWGW